MIKRFLISLLLCSPLFGDQVAVSKFGLLNNNSPATALSNTQAQDLLNVDVTPGGLSVKKRSGYGLYKALSTGQAMHGGFHAFDSSGNDYQLWGSSSSLYSIVQDVTPVQLISSATLNSTWDCTDTQGNSYCVDSNRDLFLKTNGTTKTWYTTPLGTMVESTPDRVIVAGVSGSPNTLYVSQSNTFTNFVTGVNATDAFTEVIASPGSHLTHIRWGCAKVLWWKDASFGYFDFDDQFTAQVKTVSDVIGTLDNTSAIDPAGRVWFRGQDGHTWMYDCSALTKQSVDITPYARSSGKRTPNLWLQTTQSDFQAGASSPTASLSFTNNPGSVVPSTSTRSDSPGEFSAGTFNNTIKIGSYIFIATSTVSNVPNFSFESAGGGGATTASGWTTLQWERSVGPLLDCGNVNPDDGSWWMQMRGPSGSSVSLQAALIDPSGNTLAASNPTATSICQWHTDTIFSSGILRKRAFLRITASYGATVNTFTTASSFIVGGDISFDWAHKIQGVNENFVIDNIRGGSNQTTGIYTSSPFDTGFLSSFVTVTPTVVSNSLTPTCEVFSSSSTTGIFSTGGSCTVASIAKRYVQYRSSFTDDSSGDDLSSLNSVSIVSQSTGSYYSAVKNAPNLSAWNTLGVGAVDNGSSQTFYLRSSTNSFTVLSTTPAWTVQTNGNLISISTGTYFQFRDDFMVTSGTSTPMLTDFQINYYEGSASDQAYMHYFDNSIWQTIAYGSGQAVNNYILRYDLINDGWTVYNFGAGGLLSTANTLYFGDTSAGNIYNFGTTNSDNGTAITAYWRSKAFTGTDPFLQNQLTNIDTFAKNNQGTTLTGTYTIENSTATAYSISLSTGNSAFIQSRKLLPSGKTGYTFDYKVGDASTSSAWELLGFRIGFIQLPYRPVN